MSQRLIRSLEDLGHRLQQGSRPLCLYSGGLDGAYLLHFLVSEGCPDAVALTVNLGGSLPIERINGDCQRLGVRSIVVDRRIEFASEYVCPAIAANAKYLGGHPVSASLSRPLMAKVACEIAEAEGCDLILHTATRSQNSLRRFNNSIADLGFNGSFGSPFENSYISRSSKRTSLMSEGHVGFESREHSIDVNLWCREVEGEDLDDPEDIRTSESTFLWSLPTQEQARHLTISIEKGVPLALDGMSLALGNLVDQLNHIAGGYGLGRFIGLEETATGAKVQEIREAPAAYVVLDALRRLEEGTLPAECIREKMHVEQVWVREVVEGRWFRVMREAAQAFIEAVASQVTGSLTYELAPHRIRPIGMRAAKPLYVRDRNDLESAVPGVGEKPAEGTMCQQRRDGRRTGSSLPVERSRLDGLKEGS
jgi:argininosuccinate synthase